MANRFMYEDKYMDDRFENLPDMAILEERAEFEDIDLSIPADPEE